MNLKCCSSQKFNVIVIKTAHRRSDFSKTLISQEIFASIGLRKICFKIARIFNLENVNSIFTKLLVNVGMRTDEAFYNISMYFYNINVLEYG